MESSKRSKKDKKDKKEKKKKERKISSHKRWDICPET